MFKYIVLIFSLLMVSCSTGYKYSANPQQIEKFQPISFYIDADFSKEDQTQIDLAIYEWNIALNGNMRLKIVSHNFDYSDEQIKSILDKDGVFILKTNDKVKKIDPQILAWVNNIGGNVMFVVRNRIEKEEYVKPIIMHELGHVLGLGHISEHSLMEPIFNEKTYKCVDKLTVEEMSIKIGLPINYFNYCSPKS